MLGQIFTKAQNKITDPAKLARLIEMVAGVEWVMLGSDVKGDIHEGILEKNAEDTKSGAGQYFTPRALIAAMVECMAPEPGKTIADPACGTGGFFLAAYDYLVRTHKLDKGQKAFLKNGAFHGNEIVAGTRRLCLMNLFLHNIGEIDGDSCPLGRVAQRRGRVDGEVRTMKNEEAIIEIKGTHVVAAVQWDAAARAATQVACREAGGITQNSGIVGVRHQEPQWARPAAHQAVDD